VVKRIDYDSFGNIITDSNEVFKIPIGFAGGLHDRDTGFVRLGFRDYDPDIGRWTAKDPIFFAGGDTDLYGYVLNDPINLIDPLGLEFSDILPGIKKAIVEGTRGGAYAVGEAAKATADMAMHGHPLAQTALGVAFVSEAAPLTAAAAITVAPSAVSAVYIVAPYSGAIVDLIFGFFVEAGPPKGWGYLSSGALTIYDEIKRIVSKQNASPCGN
jgi:RHS repeat-associated protein